jgi:glycosyltransferase involved in cell wall biosynthesis
LEVVDRYISEQETAEYFTRADVVVLPYRSASGTGVIPLAYRYGKPVIATHAGGLPECVVEGVSGRLVRPGDPAALADVICEFIRNDPARMHEGVKKTAEAMTWEGLAECILAFMGKKDQ